MLVAASHGTSSPAGQRAVAGLVDAVRAVAPCHVAAAFVDVEQPDVPTALDALGESALSTAPTVVVPLLLSAGYHVHVDLAEATAEHPAARLAGALGPDPRLADVLAERLAEVGLGPDDGLVLAAAGSSDAAAVVDCRRTAALLADRLGRPVRIGFLSAAEPSVADAVRRERAARPGARVVVAAYLLAPGYFHDLACAQGGDVVTAPLLDDRPADARLVDVVLDRHAEALRSRAAA
ncbi:cobalamin biosynthesis protein CbiX [Agromyces intestinalis]|uniref:Cobalamin biosynthesis protein CbiX n=1 Tax=Agromyces intestinalis TaxID=2592652 RepID=A0A5C1YLF7_9MICO|nr:cobalamin biosynthesis protein CbiX [Agromyces intestinalis]